MSRALCTECKTEQHWRAIRGARLSDHRCSKCGGRLTAYRDPNRQPAKRRRPIHIPKEYRPERYWYRLGAIRASNGLRFEIEDDPWPCHAERPRTESGWAAYEAGYRKFEPPPPSEGPPYDAATRTGMYDHW